MSLPHGTDRPYMRGDLNPASVLTWDIVHAIRQERTAGAQSGVRVTYQKLAEKYGVSVSTIKDVVLNEKWVDPSYTPPAVIERNTPRADMQGENHPGVILTWGVVRTIRDAYAQNNTTYRALGLKYGVSTAAVSEIIRNRTWVDPGYTPPPKRPWNRRH